MRLSLCKRKENLYFMLDVLSQTLQVSPKEELLSVDCKRRYNEICKDYITGYLRGLLHAVPKELEYIKQEIVTKIISGVLSIFDTAASLAKFEVLLWCYTTAK